ncbi:PKD domain-containing protein [Fulvivirgaceae bacterium BMA10]|uniref:PKD domain-containing protein n=1 Tax=Splendidivirga corallicola TaxID=3051826 RepID=A0ABT8KXN7_9BACT|nr:PKD domain-containing protein [Fulvivirgaceae bacterium BMA10]
MTILTDPICDGDVAQVQITASDAGINYEVFDQTLTSVSASTPGTGANLTITTSALSTSVTSLIVRATNPGTTCTRDFAGVGITIDAIPATPTITVTGGSLTFCEDGGTTDVDLQSSAAPNGGTYLWYKDGIATALTTQTITLNSVAESGDYTVAVTDGAGANCTSAQSAASTVTINPRPAVKTVTIVTDPICDGDAAQVQITSSDAGINYEVFDQTLTSVSASVGGTGANLTITTNALSTSVTSLIVRATNPGTTCTRDFAGVGITIDAIPATPTITVTGGSLTFCEDGGTTDVDLQSSAAPNGGTYLWYKDGIATALTTQTITLNSVAESGDYTVAVTDGAGANCTSAQSVASTVTINPRPTVKTVTILTDPICDGDAAQVQITASDAGINYEVFDQTLTSVSASTPGTGANLTITTSALSTSVTSLIVRATNPSTTCTRDFAGVGITIDAIPATPTITVTGGSLTFCEDGGTTDVDLESSAAPNGGTYLWYKDGIATALTTQTITLNSVAESGDYTVAVTDGAGANCTSAQSAASTVTINPRPTVKTVTILTDPICDGDAAQVQITASDAGINYEVFDQTLTSVSASTPGTGANLTITTSALSTAVTSLIVRATNATTTCTRDFAGVGITIDAIPATPTITVTGGSLTFCEDGGTTDVDLQSSAAPNGGTYLWYKDGIATALTTQTITLNSVAESGDYTVAVTDGAGANCTSAQSAASTVTINPRPTVKTVTILTDPICDGDAAQVQITSSDAGINYEVFDQTLTSVSASVGGTGANLTITTSALSTAVTSLIVRATNPGTTCTRDFAGVGITIDAIPATPTITVTGGSLTFCEDGGTTDVDLESSAAPNGGTYLWYKDGIATALTTQTITLNSVAESGDYTVEVTDGAGANCTSAQSAASTVTINPRPSVKTVTIVTDPICDGDAAQVQITSSDAGINYEVFDQTLTSVSASVGGTGANLTITTNALSTSVTSLIVRATNPGTTCTRDFAGVGITIDAIPATPTITVTGGSLTFCEDGGTTDVDLESSAAPNGGTYLWYKDGIATALTTQTITLNSVAESGDYTVAVTDGAGANCTSAQSAASTVTINPRPTVKTVTILTDPICDGDAAQVQITSSDAGINYEVFDQTLTSVSASTPGTGANLTITTGALSTSVTSLIVRATNPGTTCTRDFAGVGITIDAIPATPTITVTGGSLTFCEDGGTTDVDLQSSAAPNGGTYLWYKDGIATALTTQTITLNSVAESGDYTVAVTDGAGANCTSAQSAASTVTINPRPTVKTVTILTDPICDGDVAQVQITSSDAGINYEVFDQTLTSVSASVGGTGANLTITTNALSTSVTSLIVRATNPGTTCTRDFAGVGITIDAIPATPTITVTGGSLTFCEDGGTTDVDLESSAAPNGGTYLWYKDGIATALTTQTITLNSVAESGDYTVAVTDGAGANCTSAQSAASTVTINPRPTVKTVTILTDPICDGDAAQVQITSSDAGINYEVFDQTLTSVSASVGGTGANLTITTSALSTSVTSLIVRATNPGTTCTRDFAGVGITIDAIPATPTITVTGGSLTFCEDGGTTDVDLQSSAAPNGGTYLWYKDGIATALTTQTITLNSVAESGDYTVEVTDGAGANCTSAQSAASTVTINPRPAVKTVTILTDPICDGDVAQVQITASDAGINYEVFDQTLTSVSASTPGTGANLTITTSALSTSVTSLIVRATNPGTTCTRDFAGVGITIDAIPATPTITVTGGSLTFCEDGGTTDVDLESSAAPNGGTYLWYKDGIATALTTQTITLNSVAESGDYTVEVTDGAGANCTSAQSAASTVTINPRPTVKTVTILTDPICDGDVAQVQITASDAGINYEVFDQTLTSVSASTPGTGANLTITTSALSTSVTSLIVRATNPGTTCTRDFAGVGITIDAIPATPTITVTGGSLTFCEDGGTTDVDLQSSAAPNGGTYLWYKDGIATALTTQTITLNSVAESGDYTVAVTDGAGANCTSAQSAASTVTINPRPTVKTVTILTDPICDGDAAQVQITSSDAGINYEVFDQTLTSVSASVGGTGANLTITTSALSTAVTSLIVRATNPGTTCTRDFAGVGITIDAIPATPTITVTGGSLTFCEDGGTTDVDLESSAAPNGGTYLWYKDGIATALTTQTITLNSVAESGDYTVEVTDGAGANCTSAQSAASTVTINPRPTVKTVTILTDPICDGDAAQVQITSSDAGINYEVFDQTLTSVSASTPGTGANLTITTSALSTSVASLIVRATNPSTTCTRDFAGVGITIDAIPATPTITVTGGSLTFCEDGGTTDVDLQSSAAPNGGTYLWYKDGIATALTTQTITLNSVAESGDYTVAVTDGAGANCTSAQSAASTVTINPRPTVKTVTILTDPICDGDVAQVQITSSDAGINYEVFDQALTSVSASVGGTGANLTITTSALSTSVTSLIVRATNPGTTCTRDFAGVGITIDAIPATPTITVTGGSLTFCEDGGTTDVDLQSSAAPNGGTYLWYKDGIATALTTQTITLNSVAESGDYTVAVIDGAGANCTSAQSAASTVTINPRPAVKTVTILTDPICDGDVAQVQITASDAGINYEVFDQTLTSVSASTPGTGANLTITTGALSTSVTSLIVRATNPGTTCTRDFAGVGITIDAIPATPTITVTGGSLTFCEDGGTTDVDLESSAAPNGGTYLWYKDGIATALTTQTITLNSVAESGDYTVEVTDGAGANCTSAQSAASTVTINPRPTVKTVTILTDPICDGDAAQVQITASDAGINYEVFDQTLTSVSASTPGTGANLTITTSALSTAVTSLIVRATNPSTTCTRDFAGVGITIDAIPATPTITVTGGSLTFCEDGGTTDVDLESSAAPNGGTYLWYKDGIATALTTQTITLNSVAESGDYTVAVTDGAGANCTSAQSAASTVTINPRPTVKTVTILTDPICDGDAAQVQITASDAGINYEVFDQTLTSVSASVGGTGANLTITTNALSTSVTSLIVRATNPGTTCTRDFAGVGITIDAIPATPTITVTGGSLTFCEDGGTTDVDLESSAAPNGGTYLWYKDGIATALTTQTITLNSVAESGDYTVEVTDGAGANCTSAQSAASTVTINPRPAVKTVTILTDPICDGDAAQVQITSSDAGINYEVFDQTLTSVSASTPGTGANLTITTSALSTSVTSLIVRATNPSTTCTRDFAGVGITIDAIPATPTITVTSGSLTFCEDGGTTDVDLQSSAAPNGGTYLWYKDGIATALTTQTITLNSVAESGDYTVAVTDGAGANCTSAQSAASTVTINPRPTVKTVTIVTDPICDGDAAQVQITASDAGINYEVFDQTLTSVSASVGGTGANLTITTNALSTSVTSLIVRATNPSTTCTRDFAGVGITIDQQPTVAAAGADQQVCGTSTTLAGNVPLISSGNWSIISGVGGSISSPGLANSTFNGVAGTTYVLRWTISNGVCTDSQDEVSIQFDQTPTAANAGADQAVCGTSTLLSANSPAIGSGQWSFVSNPDGLGIISDINSATSFFSGSANQTYVLRWTVSNGVCTPSTDDVNIQLSDVPIVSANPITEIICHNNQSNIALSELVGVPGLVTYDWTVVYSGVSGPAGPGQAFSTDVGGPRIAETLTTTGSVTGTATYTITATSDAPFNCVSNPIVVVVVVFPEPDVMATDQTICSGDISNVAITNPNAVPGTTFNWTVQNVTGGITGASAGSGNLIAQQLINPGNTAGVVTYRITPIANGCPGATFDVDVTVNPVPDIISSPTQETICHGDMTNISLSNPNAVAGTVFNWTVVQAGGVTGASAGSGTSIQQTLSNPTNTPGTATYTITPSAGTCNGSSIVVIVTVNPQPDVLATPASETICSGSSTNITLSNPNNVTGTTFDWTVTNITGAVTGASDGTGTNITQVLNNSGPGSGTVTYTIVPSSFGCSGSSLDVVVTVEPVATANAGIPIEICDGENALLNGSIGGAASSATWASGDGLGSFLPNNTTLNATFVPDPSQVGTTVTLILTTNDPAGPCPAAVSTVPVTIHSLPTVSFGGLNPEYALNDPTVPLFGSPAGGTFMGPGIVSGVSFSPSAAGVGTHSITYTYIDPSTGCQNTTPAQSVTVNPLPSVGIPGLGATDFCFDDPDFPLVGDPVADGINTFGVFSGPGVVNNQFFRASLAGVGTHVIRYTFTDANSATNFTDVVVNVRSLPVSDFMVNNGCDGESVNFQDLSSIPDITDSIVSWDWDFGDGSPISNVQNPSHLYASPGTYDITLTVTSTHGCTASRTISLDIGAFPNTDFDWNMICFGDDTQFTDNTVFSQGFITDFSWDFDDPASGASNTSTLQNPTHRFSAPGVYNVALTVTSGIGCQRTAIRQVFILPSIQANEFPYTESFEGGTGGWVAEGPLSSWQHGQPTAVINSAAEGQNAWVTNLSGSYNQGERSWVNSPCYDFSQLERPMISFKIWSHTESGKSGAVLEASTDGGTTWQVVGGNDGRLSIGWYNESAIIGSPSSPGNINVGDIGWSGTDTGWKTAKYNLDQFRGNSSVRFRITFGADQNDPSITGLNGFGFDDIFIGERSKIVLLEHFTNMSSDRSTLADAELDQLLDDNVDEVISINYHTSFPGADVLNGDNKADPSARRLFYGISEPPTTVLYTDSLHIFEMQNSVDRLGVQDSVDVNSLEDPLFDVNVTFTDDGINSRLNINATITATDEMTTPLNEPVAVHIAVIEKSITGVSPSNPSKVFRNVLKRLLPDASGTTIDRTWNVSTSEVVSQTWEVDAYDPTNLAVVVFVQNKRTKRIYQTHYLDAPARVNSTVTGITPDEAQENAVTVKVYPTPASNRIFAKIDNSQSKKYSWRLLDQRSVLITKGSLERNQKEFSIDSSDIPSGMYYLIIEPEAGEAIHKKVIIVH